METVVTQEQEIQEVIKRAREEIERKHGKTPEELYAEREKRVTDVIQLRVPDRMPVFMKADVFSMKYAGVPKSVMYYDPLAYKKAVIKTMLDFDPDVVRLEVRSNPLGLALEKLGTNQFKWPGGPLRPDEHAQHVDMEIMKENEYDLFLTDPGDFALRYYLPREWKALAAFSMLPPLQALLGATSMASQSVRFSSPEIVQAFEAIFKAGREQAQFVQAGEQITDLLGIPRLLSSGRVVTPFDTIGDGLRGMRGIMVDMFKQPEKLHLAMERILEYHRVRGTMGGLPDEPKNRGKRIHGAGAHWGSQEFLSKKQFDTFYWPTYKKALMTTIETGFVPGMHPEGRWNDRIEHFLELPKGKAFVYNETSDVFSLKKILGGHLSFMGGVPASLLWGGSPQEVDEYCKKLIEVVGKNGGYILSCAGEEDNANPANLKAMVDAVRKYGRY